MRSPVKLAIALMTSVMVSGCVPLLTRTEPIPAAPAGTSGGDARVGATVSNRYQTLIPPDAVTDSGLFITHRVSDKLYYEIPRDRLGEEMLLVTTIARNTGGKLGGEPVDDRLIRWELHGDRILLRSQEYELYADSTSPVIDAVRAATYPSIMAAFPIEAWGPDSAAVIDVTSLFTGGISELGPRSEGNLERDRTFVKGVAAYPENIEVEAIHTRTAKANVPGIPEEYQPAPRARSIVLHWSMVRLPERPMKPRIFDERVGYFSVGKTDFGSGIHQAERYRYINRWRLECPEGERIPCEPVKPIVYHIDPATPPEWVPWIRSGVEAWQDAFEAAGFQNAIIARNAPRPEEDPNWSPEDARYSVIRWMASTTENAMGPHIHDPRTGEILVADIQMYHNSLKLVRDWYLTQVMPLDPRAQSLPLPDSLMGRLLAYIVSHEVGHTLGLQHNFRASSTYPVDSLRNERFLRRMGHVPSIMDYSRFNYLVQPEDGISPDLLIPRVGPYDEFAIRWGYMPVPDARSAVEARPLLDEWARAQDTIPWYRFHIRGLATEWGQLTEAVGDDDPVRATRLGLKNIRRTVPLLIPAIVRPGESYAELRDLYQKLISQWQTLLEHPVSLVGGVRAQEKYGGQEGWRFEPLPATRQREAVEFLNEYAFQTPDYLLDPEILRRLTVDGAVGWIGRAQHAILAELLSGRRLDRLLEFDALALPGEESYTINEFLEDLRQGIWSEIYTGRVRVDLNRANLQHSYLDLMAARVGPVSSERDRWNEPSQLAKGVLRGELITLRTSIERAIPRAGDRLTIDHLRAVVVRIDSILDTAD